jgi:hypothetical protein
MIFHLEPKRSKEAYFSPLTETQMSRHGGRFIDVHSDSGLFDLRNPLVGYNTRSVWAGPCPCRYDALNRHPSSGQKRQGWFCVIISSSPLM